MFKNYFKTAWRSIMRSKGYSALNIAGLATGLAVALLIGLWVYKEYSYDKFLPGYGQAYQVRRNFNNNGDTLNFTSTSLKLAEVLRSQIPGIQYLAETDHFGPHGLMVGDKKLYINGGITGGDFLKIFQYPLLQGNANIVFKDPYSIVLTQSAAKALFGSENVVGKTVRFDNTNNLKVSGILKDIPANSTLQFSYLIPFSYLDATESDIRNARTGSFSGNSFQIFVGLKPGVAAAQVAPQIANIEHTETNTINAMNSIVILQPVANWHLYNNYVNGKELSGFLDYVNMFAIIGGLVLLIACINFVNLTTARSEKRAKEVGVRKAIGSERRHLIVQFLVESLVITFVAFLLSLLLVQLALPAFNSLTQSRISIPFASAGFWLITLAIVFGTGLIAGSRPAFYLSSFNPVKVLKGTSSAGRASSLPRRILVVVQFSCSIALIISTVIIYQQIQYAQNRPTGTSLNRLMITDMSTDLEGNYAALKNELLQKGIVTNVTTATSPATQIWWHSDVDMWPGKNAGETIEMATIITSEDYFKTLGITLAQGRDFIGATDTTSVIFNEAAIQQMRIKNPLSQVVNWQGTDYHIVGVTKNALMSSPFAPAEPTMFLCSQYAQSNLMYRLSPSINTQSAIEKLTAVFNKYNPAFPYDYRFADEAYARKFSTEVLVGKLSGIFAMLAVFISCLGLFGLAAYIAEQRTKEIGIRKVLGASVPQIWVMLSKDFVLLVLLSCLIASPVALYFLQGWLQQYSYRISIGGSVFVWAAFAAVFITLVTVSFQSIKAAIANPVKSLRSE